MKNYFKLFACCIPVKGANVSIICDLQRSSFHYIPNEVFVILEQKYICIEELLTKYSRKNQKTLREYFDFFLEEEFGHMTSSPELFPDIENVYHTPHKINNAIVDFSSDSNHDFKMIFDSLDYLGCKHLELRFFDNFTLDYILKEFVLAPIKQE